MAVFFHILFYVDYLWRIGSRYEWTMSIFFGREEKLLRKVFEFRNYRISLMKIYMIQNEPFGQYPFLQEILYYLLLLE